MRLRAITPADLELLRHWDQQPHTPTDPIMGWGWETELDRSLEWREQFIAEIGGRPIGFIQILDPLNDEEHYWGGTEPNLLAIDIWIGEASDLGKGYGTKMMALAIERCFSDSAVTAILIDPLASNHAAHRFYERLGFRPAGRRVFGEDDCLILRFERSDWEKPPLK